MPSVLARQGRVKGIDGSLKASIDFGVPKRKRLHGLHYGTTQGMGSGASWLLWINFQNTPLSFQQPRNA